MKEPRRLLIDPIRIIEANSSKNILILSKEESHYLRKVLRLKKGDIIQIVDGYGNLWTSYLYRSDSLLINTNFEFPIERQSRPFPLIGLAVVVPKRGFDELIRMCCEIGVDIIQPLCSERSIQQFYENNKRWKRIIYEAVEQSERLWRPELLEPTNFMNWMNNKPNDFAISIAKTRVDKINSLSDWMSKLDTNIKQAWVAIGPEGGWSPDEYLFASNQGFESVAIGESILRTSTACVVSTQIMISVRNCS